MSKLTREKVIKSITDWNKDFEKTLAKNLIKKSLKKTEIAYRLANSIDEDLLRETPIIQIIDNENDSINYIIKAIKYATGN